LAEGGALAMRLSLYFSALHIEAQPSCCRCSNGRRLPYHRHTNVSTGANRRS